MEDYEPYGEEWEKELMKLPKKMLISMFKQKCENENNILKGLKELDESWCPLTSSAYQYLITNKEK